MRWCVLVSALGLPLAACSGSADECKQTISKVEQRLEQKIQKVQAAMADKRGADALAAWEYRCLRTSAGGSAASLTRELNLLGGQGWELAGASHQQVLCFKRPLRPGARPAKLRASALTPEPPPAPAPTEKVPRPLARLTVETGRPEARYFINNKPVGQGATLKLAGLKPGRHVLKVTAADQSRTRAINLEPGKTNHLRVVLGGAKRAKRLGDWVVDPFEPGLHTKKSK